ncbi:MAG: hypothetical protein K8R58_09510, partial [Bacteroidales bacterium]|nr:hypothetical protein [Bacteroidales bacterium]
PMSNGGIWNHAAHVLYSKETCSPQLTMRVILKHNRRNRIRVTTGISSDTSDTEPLYVTGYPIFDYQGGPYYMQGGTSEEDKIIEFGLDITPLLNKINSGQIAKFFLLVDENDPETCCSGEIIHYSIIDYTNGVNEIFYDETNVPLNNNDLTTLPIIHTVNYNDVSIDTDELPPATVFEPYNFQLTASGGSEPYLWDYDLNFIENNFTGNFPQITSQQLTPTNNNDGYATKDLDFSFPFYGEKFSEIKIYVDGYIMFENLYTWPYPIDDMLLFTNNKFISPFSSDLKLYNSSDDGLWYEGNQDYAIFRWKASVNGQSGTSELNFAVKLYPTGNIEYYYGEIMEYDNIVWYSAISAGNNKFYQFAEISNSASLPPNHVVEFIASHFPSEFETSSDGIFYGTAQQAYNDFEIKFLVLDNNNISTTKTLLFSTDGTNFLVIKDYSVNSGGMI